MKEDVFIQEIREIRAKIAKEYPDLKDYWNTLKADKKKKKTKAKKSPAKHAAKAK